MKTKYYKINLSKLRNKLKYLKWTLLGLLGLVILLFVVFGIYSFVYSNKVYGHLYIGQTDFRGKTKDEIKEVLKKKGDDFSTFPFILKYKDSDKDSSYQINPADIGLNIDIDKTQAKIWSVGRNNGVLAALFGQFKSMFASKNITAIYSIDSDGLKNKISLIADEIDSPEQDYAVQYTEGRFVLNDQRYAGRRIDKEKIAGAIYNQIGDLKHREINFSTDSYNPQISRENAESCLLRANKILKAGDLTLVYGSQQFKIDFDTIGGLIQSKPKGDDLELTFNEDRLKIFVDSVAVAIDSLPGNAVLAVTNGKAQVAQSSRLGTTLDRNKTKDDIKSILLARTSDLTQSKDLSKITLKVEIKQPDITNENIASLGITELVGAGTTSFVKSPANRIHNIETGAAAINGALLASGETFSTLKRLGAIDASSGYLEELVIKENRTVPEFGGGLCQVSSTLFRAAINAGMKIVERQNHKYRVSYYEPPVGIDATIYNPSPDFKFINNYASHVLIQSRIVGTKITFEIYGTKDSRTIEISNPEVFDFVDPEPPIMVETDTLPAGETKQIEKAHQGASAKFNYKVTRGEEILQSTTFTSKYVPWPERWLVGKGTPPASSTSCSDGVQNGDEAGVDCGGSCPNACSVG